MTDKLLEQIQDEMPSHTCPKIDSIILDLESIRKENLRLRYCAEASQELYSITENKIKKLKAAIKKGSINEEKFNKIINESVEIPHRKILHLLKMSKEISED